MMQTVSHVTLLNISFKVTSFTHCEEGNLYQIKHIRFLLVTIGFVFAHMTYVQSMAIKTSQYAVFT